MRSAKPAPSSSARPRPRNSPPPIRGTRPRTRMIRSARRAARRAARPPRSAPAWCRPVSAPRWSARSCGRRASAARSASSRASARSTAAARTITSARAARAPSPRRLADTWAVLRAIADRAGGDPGFVGLSGDVNFAKAHQAGAARRARNRRLERHHRRRAPGLCRGQGQARQGRRRAERPRATIPTSIRSRRRSPTRSR